MPPTVLSLVENAQISSVSNMLISEREVLLYNFDKRPSRSIPSALETA